MDTVSLDLPIFEPWFLDNDKTEHIDTDLIHERFNIDFDDKATAQHAETFKIKPTDYFLKQEANPIDINRPE